MPFFHFRQNNSGGSFEGPALHVVVEADDAAEANTLAEAEAGLYFDGTDDFGDCACCGDRWSRVYGAGDETAKVYDREVTADSTPRDAWDEYNAKKAGAFLLLVVKK